MQLSNLLWKKKKKLCLYLGVEGKANDVVSSQIVLNLSVETMLTWPSLGPQCTFLCTVSHPDFLHTSGKQEHSLGIVFALVCLACSSSHLQTSTVFFCKLQKRVPGPGVPTPNQGLREIGQGQRGGGKHGTVLVLCTRLSYRIGPHPYPQNSGGLKAILRGKLKFTSLLFKTSFLAGWNFEMPSRQLEIFVIGKWQCMRPFCCLSLEWQVICLCHG